MEELETNATEQWEPDELMAPRPKWPKVIGIISIVLGSLGLTCGGLLLLLAPFFASMMKPMLEGDPLPYGMQVGPVDYAIGGIGLLLSLLLVFAGVAGVTRRPNTRSLHLAYALCALPINVWGMINQMSKQALNVKWAHDFPNNQMAPGMDTTINQGAQITQVVTLIFMILVGIGIPALYLIWFGLIKTKPEQVTGEDEEAVF